MRLFSRGRWLPLLFLAVVAALGVGCQQRDPMTTIAPKSDVGSMIQGLYVLLFWLSVVVFVVVEGLLVYAVLRFRAKPGQGIPAQVHGNNRLEIAWTIAPAIILVVIAVPTWATIFKTAAEPGPNALRVEVVARQWWWEFRYPELNLVTANELHLPVDRQVAFTLKSGDVIHSFWVPQLGGKQDVVPGRVNKLQFTPNTTGTYYGQCVELCGASHALMRMRAIVQTQEDFDAWVKGNRTPPTAPTGAEAQRGADVFAKGACVACHTIEGTPGKGTVGPNLTYFGSRTTLAAGIMPNTAENIARWLRDPAAVKPQAKMPNLNLSEHDISALVAYLSSLKLPER
ncbi:MAG: cytochrome c oxidase subunit II [Chloroflexi bacterium]|nr:cytochrome c oxidase subunit II [Chloroflexota bacterium]